MRPRSVDPLLAAAGAAGAAGLAALALAWGERTGRWLPLFGHGLDPAGRPWIQRFGPGEPALFAVQLLLLPAVILAASALVRWAPLAALDRSLGSRPGRWRLAAALTAALVATCWSVLVFHGTPITDDEDVYLFQARIFASGHGALPSPEPRTAFDAIFVVNDGRWFGQYPPGHPLALVPGVLAGAPRAIPPLLLALAVWWLSGAVSQLMGPREAVIAAWIAAASPFLTAMAGTQLSQTTSLAALALGLHLGLNATRTGRSLPALGAGLAMGFAVLVRPASAVLVGGPLALAFLPGILRTGRRRAAGAFLAGGLVMGLAGLLFNRAMTGSPWVSPYMAYWLPREGLRSPFGFGDFPWGLHHTVTTGIGNLWRNAVRLDGWLTGWPLAVPAALAALPVVLRRRGGPGIVTAAVLSPLVYVAYFWPGIPDVGPILLAETALGWLPLLALVLAGGETPAARRLRLGWLLAGTVLAWTLWVPVPARALQREAWEAGRLERAVRRAVDGRRAVVFTPLMPRGTDAGSWRLGRPLPHPDLSDTHLFLLTPPTPSRAADLAARHFPDRIPLLARWVPGHGFLFRRLDKTDTPR